MCYDFISIFYSGDLAEMRYRWLAFILLSTLSLGQASGSGQQKTDPAAHSKAASSLASESEVVPQAPVITINGLCDNFAPGGVQPPADSANSRSTEKPAADASALIPVASANCKTIVTREQFESVVNALNSKASPEKRRRFARDYVELLVFAGTALRLGLDKNPDFVDFLRYKYSQGLQAVLLNYMQGKADDITDADVEKYYKDHPERFQEISLMRIFVPLPEHKGAGSDTTGTHEEMQGVAEKIQREAAAGGNFEKLEAKAYKAAHSEEEPPEVDMGNKWTIDNLPPEHRDRVIHMQPGEVSPLIRHAMGWQIFKVTARRTVPLSEAKPMLQQLRMKDARQALTGSVDPQFNETYFSAPADAENAKSSTDKGK